jgi:hypothetical protein
MEPSRYVVYVVGSSCCVGGGGGVLYNSDMI